MNLIDFLDRGARLSPQGHCLIEGDETLSYPEVVQWTHRIAHALTREGLGPQSRIGTLTPNNLWGYLAILGLQRARGIWIPLNGRSSVDDNIAHMRRTGCQWLFYLSDQAPLLERIRSEVPTLQGCIALDRHEPGSLQRWAAPADCGPFPPPAEPVADDLFRITVSGGTTGAPKAIMQTQRGVQCNVASCLAVWRYDEPPRFLLTRPMTHTAGIGSLHILALGGTIVIMRTTNLDEVLDTIERHRIQVVSLAPTTIYSLIAREDIRRRDLSSLRYVTFGGAPMSADKLAEAMGVFGPVLAQAYAQSEASTMLTVMTPQDYREVLADPTLAHRLRSCGKASPFMQIEVMAPEAPDGRLLPDGETGEIVVRGDMVMRGYWGDDAAKDAEVSKHGWHHTGDIGYRDADGFFYIVDRIRDLIITGAFNVFPSDVEQVLWGHPAVKDCAVIGVPDEKWGEAVKAVVELKAGLLATEAELIALCKDRLGSIKAPKTVEFWDTLPRSDVGKVLKKEVRKRYWPETSGRRI